MKKLTFLVVILLLITILPNNIFFMVTKADTFGRTEPAREYEAQENMMYMSKFTMVSTSLEAISMSIYIHKCGRENIRLFIYDCDDKGEPGVPLAETGIQNLGGTTEEWVTFNLQNHPVLEANQDYWLGFIVDGVILASFDEREGTSRYSELHFDEPLPEHPRVEFMDGEFAIYCTVGTSNKPTISNPQPYDGAVWVRLQPKLSVQINSTVFPVDITWYTNASGTWQVFATNSSVTSNGTYSQVATSFNQLDTTYWWKVNVSHNSTCYTETDAFSLHTAPDEMQIQIYFAGADNVGGGTAYFDANYTSSRIPPDAPAEDSDYKNIYNYMDAENGRYVHSSHQINNYIVVKAKVFSAYDVTSAYLHLKNLNTGTWDNSTPFTVDNSNWKYIFLECNKTVSQRGNYTFEIYVQNENGDTKTFRWYKRDNNNNKIIRKVELGCTPTDNIEYRIMYYRKYPFSYATVKPDILPHDGGSDGSIYDTGRLISSMPTDVVEERHCAGYVGFWFEDDVCIEPTQIQNVYLHDWWKTDYGYWENGIGFSKRILTYTDVIQTYSATTSDAVSSINYIGSTYYLTAHKIELNNPINVDTNSIYNIFIGTPDIYSQGRNPSLITNRSFTSFVIFNIPDNATLQTMDSDGDGLNDYQELFSTYTNPFVVDTDGDGDSDYHENLAGTDPNDYKDEPSNNAPYAESPIPAIGETDVDLQPTCSVKVYDDESSTVTVKFYENTTGSWILRQTNLSVPVGTRVYWTYTQADQSNTTYWWKVTVIDETNIIASYVYKFTTKQELGNNPPSLTNPSATPSSGVADYTTFYFNITYTDADGDAPTVIKVNISKTGWYINTTMTYISGSYTNGALYSYSTTLPSGTYNYLFYASDGTDSVVNDPTDQVNVEAQSYSFTVSTADPSGQETFTASAAMGAEWNVSASYQTSSLPAIQITNTGNVPINISINLTTSPISNVHIKYNTSSSPPSFTINPYQCDKELTTTPVQVISYLQPSSTLDIWLWADFESKENPGEYTTSLYIESSGAT